MGENVIIRHYANTFFSCEVEEDYYCEEMVREHMLVYLRSGALDLVEAGGRSVTLNKGAAFFVPRNHRVTKIKRPDGGEPFKGLFVQMKRPVLQKVFRGYKGSVSWDEPSGDFGPYTFLGTHPFLDGLFQSLELYFSGEKAPSGALLENKLQEAILTVLEIRPGLAPVLFDTAGPKKVDLRTFMEDNFTKDLSLEELAHFSGRSLTGFKQEFNREFNVSPMRWVTSRRLEEAHTLIEEQGKPPVDVYLGVGFKNLSHFSTAYKHKYGHSPRKHIINI